MQLINYDLNKFNLFTKKAQVDKVHRHVDEEVDKVDKWVDWCGGPTIRVEFCY